MSEDHLETGLETGLSSANFASELARASSALEEAVSQGDAGRFFEVFRQTELPFVPIAHGKEPRLAFHYAVEILRQLSAISPAVALAVENHLYVMATLATLPIKPSDPFHARREELIASVRQNRWLVANTNSRVHGNKVAASGTVAKYIGGRYHISGKSSYMSLSTEGDLIVFLTFFETGEPALFCCPLKGNPQIEIGAFSFPDAMLDSDTRRVTFEGLVVDEHCLLASGSSDFDMVQLLKFQMSWHQALLAALSLGTTARAIDEGRRFLRATRNPDGTPLADLDGMIADIGRCVLRYRSASAAVEFAGDTLSAVAAQPFLKLSDTAETFECSCCAKYVGAQCAEDVVGAIRRMMGARAFVGGQPIERLSNESMFAPLTGEGHAAIERRAGRDALGETSFLSQRDLLARQRSGPRASSSLQLLAERRKRRLRTRSDSALAARGSDS